MCAQKCLDIGNLNSLYGELLTERQRSFIRLCYDCDLSLNEIGDMYGISKQGVKGVIDRGSRELLRLENALGFWKRIQEITKICEGLSDRGGARAIEDILFRE